MTVKCYTVPMPGYQFLCKDCRTLTRRFYTKPLPDRFHLHCSLCKGHLEMIFSLASVPFDWCYIPFPKIGPPGGMNPACRPAGKKVKENHG